MSCRVSWIDWGIADHVAFVAVYAALAVTSSRRHGNLIYLLIAISAAFHAIQSASYETERQEYEYLGWGKTPQNPPPRNGNARATDSRRVGPGGQLSNPRHFQAAHDSHPV
jgi:hypothetical protein